MKKLATLAAAFALTMAASAYAAPRSYEIEGTHTFPRFSYDHWGYSTQLGRFNRTTGTVVYDAEARTASVDVVIDMRSVDTGVPLFDERMQSPELLDTASHPQASFRSTRVVFDGGAPVAVEGELTIKGVSRPVTLRVSSFKHMPHPLLKKDAIGANASTTIRRSDFGAGKYAPNVGDEVRIDIAIEAVAQETGD